MTKQKHTNKIALITGVTGQDGAYLAELLLGKGYVVHGIKRRSSLFNTDRIDHLYQDPHVDGRNFVLHYGDLTDSTNLIRIIQHVQPDEIYNLAAQSHVAVSFEEPEYTANCDGLGTLRLLEAIRILGLGTKTRFYQASTSELYGLVQETPQKETTPFYPRSPYAVAKLYAYWITVNYREAYGMYACNGILFNHESPMRGETFVTRKITRAMARIALGLQDCLYLGNMSALRDWGHARDYVEMQWLMLQQDQPDDFVIATGVQYSVRQFVQFAGQVLGIVIRFEGEGTNEVGIVDSVDGDRAKVKAGDVVVKIDPRYFRPTEFETLLGDPTKAKEKLGWTPTATLKWSTRWSRPNTPRPSVTRRSSSRVFKPTTITNEARPDRRYLSRESLRDGGFGDRPRVIRRWLYEPDHAHACATGPARRTPPVVTNNMAGTSPSPVQTLAFASKFDTKPTWATQQYEARTPAVIHRKNITL